MLVLFDIDGTLLRGMPPLHRQALCAAAGAIFGVVIAPEALGQTAGMTDHAIFARALAAAGVPRAAAEARMPALCTLAVEAYRRDLPPDLRVYRTPYAGEVLAALAARGIAVGLVTGNIEGIAWAKLGAAGLARPFGCGAFGNEAEARDALPPLAVARAARHFGRAFTPEEVYVVGDTPADIACGTASGYHTVAVATGKVHSLAELRACDPDAAFPDLRGLVALLGATMDAP